MRGTIKRTRRNRCIFFPLFIILILGTISYLYFYSNSSYISIKSDKKQDQPSLHIYPFHKESEFIYASSKLSILSEKKNAFQILLSTSSKTSDQANLRQDIALIYSNGVLVEHLNGWKKNATELEQELLIHGAGATRYDVISFHHAEFLEDNQKTSQQFMSSDQFYILDSAFSSSSSFRKPETNTQKHWQRILDHAIKDQWQYQRNHLIQYFNIDLKEYELIPFTQLYTFDKEPFPSFSKAETKKIIGEIWESINRYYMSGTSHALDKKMDPIGSTVPILLLAKDTSHLKILFRTDKGKDVQIIQRVNKN